MFETLFSILFVYLFIALGYLAKRLFKERLDAKSLTIMSVYFMQPFVGIWGFSTASLSPAHFKVVGLYFAMIAIGLAPTLLLAKSLFDDTKERAIFSIAGFVGNTGNIGIPLGIALFGTQSVIYTTMINLANVIVVYLLGAYIYSRGSFDVKRSIRNMLSIPIIPASLVAIAANLMHLPLPAQLAELLKMGAYSGIVLQLFLLGTFLYGIRITQINPGLFVGVLTQKFLLVPLLSALVLYFSTLSPTVQAILLMEMLTPLAVANINLASLYDCKPHDVGALILLSTLLFTVVLVLFVAFVLPIYGI